MRRRLQRAVMGAVVAALAVFALPLGFGATALIRSATAQDTERVALEAAFRIGPTFRTGDPVELPPRTDADVGVYTPTGSRVNGVGPAHLEPAALQARTGVIQQVTGSGGLVVAVPITANESVIGIVRAARRSTAAEGAGVWLALAAIAALVVLATSLLARRTAAQLAKPVEALADTAREMGAGRLLIEPRSSAIEEVDAAHAALVDAGGRIADLVAREQRIASDASHQLRTPLAGLRGSLELGLRDPAGDRLAVLEQALAQVDRMDATIDDLIALARRVPQDGSACDPLPLLKDRVAHWNPLFDRVQRSLALVVDGGTDRVAAPPAALTTVLDVLLENTLRHGSGATTVTARAHGAVVAIDVEDGVDYRGPEDPFADGVSGDGGSGLGLGLARRVADSFGGRLLLSATSPRTRFGLLVPTARTPSEPGRSL